jgi:target of rapamycin complex 2 subunit MAPKAP1
VLKLFDYEKTSLAFSIVVEQNRIIESEVQRRPSRVVTSKKQERLVPTGLTLPPIVFGTSGVPGSTLGSVPLSTSLNPSSSHGPQIFLRIRVAETADAVHISTTIPVYAIFVSFLIDFDGNDF